VFQKTLTVRPILFMLGLLVLLEYGCPLAHKITLVAGVDSPLVHRPLVVPQAPLDRGLVVALVTGEGDPGVLGHPVHLETVGLGGLIVAHVAWVAFTLVNGLTMLA
jgi:hypothetical protein